MISFEKGVQSGLISKPPSTQDKNKFIRNGVEKATMHKAIPKKKEPVNRSPDSKSSSGNLVEKIYYKIEQNEQWKDMKNKEAKMYIKGLATNPKFSAKRLCMASWLVNVFKGSKKHAKEAYWVLELCGIKEKCNLKQFGEAINTNAIHLSRGMTFEFYIGLYKSLYHDPTSEFYVFKDKESPNDDGCVHLKASKSTNSDVVVVPSPKNVVLSLPTPSSSDKSSEEESDKSPLLLKSLVWKRLFLTSWKTNQLRKRVLRRELWLVQSLLLPGLQAEAPHGFQRRR